MSLTRRIRWCGVVERHRDALALLSQPGDVALVERGRPRHIVVRCPCGCGDDISLNVDPQAGPSWRLIRRGERVSLSPSVWRETGCESHFFVWRDEVDWLDWAQWIPQDPFDDALVDRVARVLDPAELRSIHEIAFDADVSLSQAYRACQQLVSLERAEEGEGRARGLFRAASRRDQRS